VFLVVHHVSTPVAKSQKPLAQWWLNYERNPKFIDLSILANLTYNNSYNNHGNLEKLPKSNSLGSFGSNPFHPSGAFACIINNT
jgi:hypothetical protein